MDIFIQIISAIAIAAISSWITVQLSTNKFRSERWWEKKVIAYERVIEAFHNSNKFEAENMEVVEHGRELTDERDKELRSFSKIAREEILKASDIGSFVLSKEALKILEKYKTESNSIARQETWYEALNISWSITNRYMQEIIKEAHRDLKTET